MKVDGLWATPIYHSRLDNQSILLVQEEFKKVYDSYILNATFNKRSDWENRSHSLSDISFNSNFIEEFNLIHFKKVIEIALKQYMFSINQPTDYKYKLYESWMTLTKHNEFAIPHNHPPADISGVYYYQTNGNDGDITFIAPPLGGSWVPKSGSLLANISYKPEVGRLLLFPGWLTHYVKANETYNNRVSVSFNIKFHREKSVL
jgi:uncharacterized protein (TIGR02466 family)